jgi:hypothetical protein
MANPINQKQRTENLILIITFLLIFNITINTPADYDTWWHLRAGDEMWHTGKILLQDTFSYTRNGAAWVNAFWLSDIGMYGTWKLGSFFALTIVVCLLAVAVMAIVYLQLEGHFYLKISLLLLTMFAAGVNWSPRPQIISFLLLALLDYYLHIHRHVKKMPLWVLIPLFALWGNLHGGFIWGILLLLSTLAGEIFDRILGNQPSLSWHEIFNLLGWSILGGLAVMINPNGWAIWGLPFYQVEVSLLSITEWLSPNFHNFFSHPALWLLFLLIIGLAFSKRHVSFVDLFKGLGFTYMFFVAQRNMAPYAIIITPIIAPHLTSAYDAFYDSPLIRSYKAMLAAKSASRPLAERITFIINAILVSMLVVFNLTSAYISSTPIQINSKVPAQAVSWIRKNLPEGPIFNSYNWGGYLTWSLRDYPVYIDGRADLYGDQIISEWLDIANGTEKGITALDKRGIKLIFLEPNWPLIEKLPLNGWKELYTDEKISIYGR